MGSPFLWPHEWKMAGKNRISAEWSRFFWPQVADKTMPAICVSGFALLSSFLFGSWPFKTAL